ncbi:HAD hydrolase-like protein [Bacillus rugosus]|uniref:HAD hydrolase-like protein n=1 Tax=Bacillus rugosus TaxID=2715209 RepID=UPI002DBD0C1E|nr:HAD hydrolase-like protein [Bacillus rugosus]MEC1550107.1 HAD hydrolase-like protein [Bacillus rugosus]
MLELSLDDAFDYLRSLGKWDTVTPIEKYREILGVPLPEVGKGALYPHVEEMFSYLKNNNYSIFIASNSLIEYLKAIVSFYQLDRWVTETFSIQQIHTLNKGDLVNSIVQKYGIQHAAVVGDRLSDINAAKDNGLLAIGCHFDFAKEEELAQADFVIHDLIELKTLLREMKIVGKNAGTTDYAYSEN